jgi:hypothetical protein
LELRVITGILMLAAIIMENETLLFKDKIIQGNNVEIIFHKDYTYNYNAEAFPVVKYTLLGCQDLASKNFQDIDFHNNGLFIETREEGDHHIFEATGMGGDVFQIGCKKIVKENLEYRKQDYIDLLKEIIKQRDEEYDVTKKYYQQFENLKLFLEKEIDINERKLIQANWLTSDKRKLIEGELSGLRKVFEMLTNWKIN